MAKNFMPATVKSQPPLPAPGLTPWWVALLEPMTKELESLDGWTWTTGGCFAFADRLQKAYGGKLWCVARYDPEYDDWTADHAVVRVQDVFYDFNGVFDPEAYVRNLERLNKRMKVGPFQREMKPKEEVNWFADEFLDDNQWRDLLSILKTGRSKAGARQTQALEKYHAKISYKP